MSNDESPLSPTDGKTRPPSEYHEPVLLAEVIDALHVSPGRLIVDGTLGGGGHTRAILAAGAKVIGIDQDENAIRYCLQQLSGYSRDTVRLVRGNFRHLPTILGQLNVEKVDGVLLDIGVSSTQLDLPERGFSFQRAGPIDMRMDQSATLQAADLVNNASQDELARLFRQYGEEPAAGRAASAIVRARAQRPLRDTLALAEVIEKALGKRGPRHPATRIFQALRIAVNDELGALAEGLGAVASCLRAGGRLAVITFHSLEDRLVKDFCRATTVPTIDRPEWPAPRPNPRLAFSAVTRRPITASADEQRRNPRSRSAKLRVLERLADAA